MNILTSKQLLKLSEDVPFIENQEEYLNGFVIDVYDGDTYTIIYELEPFKFRKTKIRLNGVNCPEIRTSDKLQKQAGYKVRDYVRKRILHKKVELTIIKFDKYGGRHVGDIDLLAEELIAKEYAHAYNGKNKKQPWTIAELEKIINDEELI